MRAEAFWRGAAEARERRGETTTAIFFRNLAWQAAQERAEFGRQMQAALAAGRTALEGGRP